MKKNYTSVKKLTDKSKDFKLKLKVVHKGSPGESPSKRRFQKLVFKDEEGNTIKGTLFGKDIETYEEALQRNGEYELSDVTVKHLPPQFRSRPDEEYQINLGGRMKIKALNLSECSNEPQYRQLANVPTTFTNDDPLLDIAAVVVFVGDIREEKFADFNQQVRDIILADQSVSRPIKLTARNRFALDEAANFMTNWHEDFQIIGFIGIRPITFRGLSLSTTLSSTYIANPTGQVPQVTSDWMRDHMAFLGDWRDKAMTIYSPTASKTVTPLATIAQKKASTIWQDEYYWVIVNLPALVDTDIYFYYGCSNCGKRASNESGSHFYCYQCRNKEATLEAKLVLNSDLGDASGTLTVTAYTTAAENIISMSAEDFYSLKKQDTAVINNKLAEIKHNHLLLKIGPNHELSTSNVLKWIVSVVEPAPILENITSDEVLPHIDSAIEPAPVQENIPSDNANKMKSKEEQNETKNTESDAKKIDRQANPAVANILQTEPTEEQTRIKKRRYNDTTTFAEILPNIVSAIEGHSNEGSSKQLTDDDLEDDNNNSTDEDTFDNAVYADDSQDPEA